MRDGHMPPTIPAMGEASTYAVSWRDGGTRFIGYAELRGSELRLEGRGAGGREELRTVPYANVVNVVVRRSNGSRLIALELRSGEAITIRSLDRPGSLGELADQLRTLTDSPHV